MLLGALVIVTDWQGILRPAGPSQAPPGEEGQVYVWYTWRKYKAS